MKYIVIGLGNYGHVLAEELGMLGHEVIGADIDEVRVEFIKEKVATAFQIDATDEYALAVLPLQKVDGVIVAVGDFGASIRIVALLKKFNVKHIYARAVDEVHKSILEAFDLDQVLTPEEDAARSLVQVWEFGTEMEVFKVDLVHYVVKFRVPNKFIGYYLAELNLESEFNLKTIALKRKRIKKNSVGITTTVREVIEVGHEERVLEEDELVCFGKIADFQDFWRAL